MNKPDQPQLYTVNQAAEVLTVSVNTIGSQIWQGRIPIIRLVRSVRIPKQEIDSILNRNYQKAEQAIAL